MRLCCFVTRGGCLLVIIFSGSLPNRYRKRPACGPHASKREFPTILSLPQAYRLWPHASNREYFQQFCIFKE